MLVCNNARVFLYIYPDLMVTLELHATCFKHTLHFLPKRIVPMTYRVTSVCCSALFSSPLLSPPKSSKARAGIIHCKRVVTLSFYFLVFSPFTFIFPSYKTVFILGCLTVELKVPWFLETSWPTHTTRQYHIPVCLNLQHVYCVNFRYWKTSRFETAPLSNLKVIHHNASLTLMSSSISQMWIATLFPYNRV
jgi:hypothetical protein